VNDSVLVTISVHGVIRQLQPMTPQEAHTWKHIQLNHWWTKKATIVPVAVAKYVEEYLM